LSIEDLAQYLGVPVTTIYDWRVDGTGPCGVRVGRHVRFTRSDVLTWIQYLTAPNGRVKARVRFRDDDGQLRFGQQPGTPASRPSGRSIGSPLDATATRLAVETCRPDSTFGRLVEVWLADLDLVGKLAPSTRALYERNMRQLVMPALEHYTLHEI